MRISTQQEVPGSAHQVPSIKGTPHPSTLCGDFWDSPHAFWAKPQQTRPQGHLLGQNANANANANAKPTNLHLNGICI